MTSPVRVLIVPPANTENDDRILALYDIATDTLVVATLTPDMRRLLADALLKGLDPKKLN